MPFKTGLVYTYDCGEFEKNMDEALAMADYAGFEERRAQAARRGKLPRHRHRQHDRARGRRRPAPRPPRSASIPTGTVTLVVGTTSQGQSHETMYKILLADKLGLDSPTWWWCRATPTRSSGAPAPSARARR